MSRAFKWVEGKYDMFAESDASRKGLSVNSIGVVHEVRCVGGKKKSRAGRRETRNLADGFSKELRRAVAFWSSRRGKSLPADPCAEHSMAKGGEGEY